jgi:hypothetical protein
MEKNLEAIFIGIMIASAAGTICGVLILAVMSFN